MQRRRVAQLQTSLLFSPRLEYNRGYNSCWYLYSTSILNRQKVRRRNLIWEFSTPTILVENISFKMKLTLYDRYSRFTPHGTIPCRVRLRLFTDLRFVMEIVLRSIILLADFNEFRFISKVRITSSGSTTNAWAKKFRVRVPLFVKISWIWTFWELNSSWVSLKNFSGWAGHIHFERGILVRGGFRQSFTRL